MAAVLGLLLLSACDAGAPGEPRAQADVAGGTAAGPPPEPYAEPGVLTLAFAGDVHFEGGLSRLPAWDRATLGPMSRSLREADLAVVNLEAALTDREQPARKELEDPGNRYWFRVPSSVLGLLERSGVDVVSVANNHGADHGEAGLRDTLRLAEDSPVAVVGAGADPAQAFAPYRTTVRGTDVAVLAADASPLESRDPTWTVSEGRGPGLASARGEDTEALLTAVRDAAALNDLVVVYVHWGEEGEPCPTRGQESLAAQLAEAGADVVVGAHAHVPQGAGTIGGTYVAYGLGNFFWYHGLQADTGVLRLRLRGGEVLGDEWVPGRIRLAGGNPQPLTGRARAVANEDWRGLRGCTSLAPGPSEVVPEPTTLPAYAAQVRTIGRALRQQMVGRSHDPDRCPVPLSDLRHLTLSYVDRTGAARTGGMVVHADVADDVVEVFRRLYEARFPITRMRLVDAYGGDDDRSMAADNTSGYNCRTVAGQTTWSDHAYGRAVDINPVQNPYVTAAGVLPPAGAAYVETDRSAGARTAPGVIARGDVVTEAFAAVGWEWGGLWSEPDYQHFSAP